MIRLLAPSNPSHNDDMKRFAPGYAPVLEAMKRFVTLDPIILKGNYGITEGGLTAADPEVVDGITEGVWFDGIINSPAQHAYVKIGQAPLYAPEHEPIKYEAKPRRWLRI